MWYILAETGTGRQVIMMCMCYVNGDQRIQVNKIIASMI